MNDVCFINPPAPAEGVYLPTGLIRLHGIAYEAGFNTALIDLEEWRYCGRISFPRNFAVSLERELRHVKALVFAVTTMNVTWPWAAIVIRILRELHPESVIIAGGPQVTLHKGTILEYAPDLDMACVGDWENGIVSLLESIILDGDPTEIPGLFLRQGNRIVSTGDQSLEDNLPHVPVLPPATISYYRNVEVLNIDAGRGCAYGCRFCSVAAISGRRSRFKSPEGLIAETCAYLEMYDSTSEILVSYEHDNFLGEFRFLEQFADLKQKRGLSYSYACSIRLDLLSEPAIHLLAQSGCRVVFIGVESGSPAVQHRCGKNLIIHRIEPVVRRLASCGIIAACNFIIGLPNETIDELHASIELMGCIVESGGRVGCSIFCPEPGSFYGQVFPPEEWIPVRHSSWYQAMTQTGIAPEEQNRKLHAFLYTIPNQHYDIELIAGKSFGFAYLLNHFSASLQHLRRHLNMTWTAIWEDLDDVCAYPGNEMVAENLLHTYWEQQMYRVHAQHEASGCMGKYDEFVQTLRRDWAAAVELQSRDSHPSRPVPMRASL